MWISIFAFVVAFAIFFKRGSDHDERQISQGVKSI